jgi:prepilin signal peptidase PulO-like enzyme (type II secretory pathway)
MSDLLVLGVAAPLFGAILGSFINALSFRFNTGRSILWARSTSLRTSRSRCMHCNHTLASVDLVPVFSYLWLRGRCRYCRAHISVQYPLVEVSAALLAAMTYFAHPEPVEFFFWLFVWMVLLFVVVYDLRHTIIPLSCSALLIVLALSYLAGSGLYADPLYLLAGPLLAAPLFLFSLVSKGQWMGWGDGLLEMSLGWLLGLTLGLTALMLAFWSGAAVGIALLAAKRGITMKSEVPFAPFLALGALIVHFSHVDLFSTLPVLLAALF